MATVLDSVRALFAPNNTFTIDAETPADVVARENLLDRAMGPDRRLKSSEKIRRGRVPAEGLALVARDHEGHVIGTVRLWNIEAGIAPDDAPCRALLLGPLAVDSAHEGKGIGAALMRAAIDEAHKRDHGAILLVGDAAYYERFGFCADETRHLVMPGPFERSRFLALELKAGWLEGAAGMIVASGSAMEDELVSDCALQVARLEFGNHEEHIMNAKEYREFCAEAQAIALQGYHGYSRRKLPENGREVLMSYDTLDKTFLVIETAFETLEHANPDAYIWGVSRWSGDWKASVTVGEKLQLRHALEAAGRVPKPRKDRFGDGFSDYHQSWFSIALADVADAEAPSKIDAVAREFGMYDRIYSEGFAVQDNGEGPGEFDEPGVHFRKAAEDGSSHWRIGSIEQKIVFPHPSFPHWYVERVDDTSGYRVGVYNLTLDAALLYEAVPAPSPDQEYPVSSFVSWEEFENAEDKSAAPDIG